jgi:hypothetical protein
MDHRPFEDWLLNNQILEADEKRQLNAHLQVCSSCSALAEVNLALKSVKMAEPSAGFADRFQVRLEARKQALRRRNLIGFLLLTVSVLSVLTWVTWPFLSSFLQSPVNVLASWLTSILSLWTAILAMTNTGVVLFKVVPGFIPAYVWTIVLFAGCGWSLLWVFSFIKIIKLPQGVS